MGRPRAAIRRESWTIRIHPGVRDEAKALASRVDVNASVVVERALEMYLDAMIDTGDDSDKIDAQILADRRTR